MKNLMRFTFLILLAIPTAYSQGHAATITVDAENGDITVNGECSINEALGNANVGGIASNSGDCTPGTSGADTIVLTVDVVIADGFDGDSINGRTGTKSVQSEIVIDGKGFKLSNGNPCVADGENATDATEFRLLHVSTNGYLTIKNFTLEAGCADGQTGLDHGGAIYNAGTLTVENSALSNNESYGEGGAIYNAATGSLSISDSVISGNSAFKPGGGLSNSGNVIAISDSSFSNNAATTTTGTTGVGGFGGAIYHSGDASIASISSTTFSNNSAQNPGSNGEGGAMLVTADITEISNSTFSGNTTDASGGAISMKGVSTTITTIKNNTFSNNTAATDSGLANLEATLQNFTNNLFAQKGSANYCIATGWGAINAANNLSDGSCPGSISGEITNFDATLNDNGGLTETHALLEGSNAIDAGDDAVCPRLDQRGYVRKIGSCDIGSYEYGAAPPVTGVSAIQLLLLED